MKKAVRKKREKGDGSGGKKGSGKKKQVVVDEEIDEECAFTAEDVELKAMFENMREEPEVGDGGEGEDEDEDGDSSDDRGMMNLSEMLDASDNGQNKAADEHLKLLKGKREGSDASSDGDDGLEEEFFEEGDSDEDGVDDHALKRIQRVATGRVIRKRKRMEEELSTLREEDPNMVAPGQQKTTVSALLGALEGKSQFGDLKKKLERVNREKPLAPDLHEHQIKKIERDVAYGKTSAEASRWQSLVKKNREAPLLKFPMNAQPTVNPSTAMLASTFEPLNETELEIAQILKKSGMSNDQDVQKGEDLQLNALSKEEVMARKKELAKMRSLMFYHEKKMKRIKKIKSKRFRKSLKKDREKAEEEAEKELAADDPEAALHAAMEKQRQRAEERMSLRHKNTSKWIKRQLQQGTGRFDEGTRQAINEQLGIGVKLKKKQRGSTILQEREEAESSDDSGAELDEEKLEEMLTKEKEDLEKTPSVKGKSSLFNMKFMQQAMEKRKLAAQELLKEMEGEENSEDVDNGEERVVSGKLVLEGSKKIKKYGEVVISDEDDDEGDMEAKLARRVDEQRQMEAEKDEEEEYSGRQVNLSVATTARPGHKTQLVGRLGVDTEALLNVEETKEKPEEAATSTIMDAKQDVEATVASKKARRSKTSSDAAVAKVDNPWLMPRTVATEPEQDKKGEGNVPSQKRVGQEARVSVAVAADVEVSLEVRMKAAAEARNAARKGGKDLVRAAFAGAGAEEEDFQREKEETVNAKLPSAKDVGAVVLPGWGNWGGKGSRTKAAQERFAKNNLEKLQKARDTMIKKRKDSAPNLTHVVLSEKRVKKTSALTVAAVPFPYKSREQYEASLAVPLGREWVAPSVYRDNILPDTMTKLGTMIDPIKFGGQKGKIRAQKRKPLAS